MMTKFPKIYHVPWSPGVASDDRIVDEEQLKSFKDRMFVMLEKLDGECTTMSKDAVWARSFDGRSHASQDWVKREWARVSHELSSTQRIIGENIYGKHSIDYDNRFDSHFFVFQIWDSDVVLSWSDTRLICAKLGLRAVPEIGTVKFAEAETTEMFNSHKAQVKSDVEGYVLREWGSFDKSLFNANVAKYVRANHVQTDKHWRATWTPNVLRK